MTPVCESQESNCQVGFRRVENKNRNQKGHSSRRPMSRPVSFVSCEGRLLGSGTLSAVARYRSSYRSRHDIIEISKNGCLAVPQLRLIMLGQTIRRHGSGLSRLLPCSAAVHHHLTQRPGLSWRESDIMALFEHCCGHCYSDACWQLWVAGRDADSSWDSVQRAGIPRKIPPSARQKYDT